MMAIEKNTFKTPRISEFSPVNAYSEEDEGIMAAPSTRAIADFEEDQVRIEEECEDDDEDEFHLHEVDSGCGSDDYDLLELGDSGSEFCQIGNATCSVPFELFDLPGLESVLSVETWNDSLSDDERLELTKFLPEMDQLTFMRTLKELLDSENFHFGSPLKKLFRMMTSGLCEPRVSLYCEGLSMFQKRKHCHSVRTYHNSMVTNLCLARNAWMQCRTSSVDEKLRLLNSAKTQSVLAHEKGSDSFELLKNMSKRNCSSKKETYSITKVNGYERKGEFYHGTNGVTKVKKRKAKLADETESDSSEYFSISKRKTNPKKAAVKSGKNKSESDRSSNENEVSPAKKRKSERNIAQLWKVREDEDRAMAMTPVAESISSKKRNKKKPESEVEHGAKPAKASFTPITPTVHTSFSFSIIHLLTAVRIALTTPPSPPSSPPNLTVQQIVSRVKSQPYDPRILETPEPLSDLVRGALKVFCSKTAPLGTKGWKPLVAYTKSSKTWQWIGAMNDVTAEEDTSPEKWGLPYKNLVKLVDAFANWLKCGQETLVQIGTLPDPPLSLTNYSIDEKERFRDLRAQKSLNTINPSTEEVRSYFRKEEFLRYSVPDRVFLYTAADGKKSIVAPLRRCGGKPTSKARDHFMLKRDRPPHVTILCLVRDAAARLPGSIGTRADVCTLIRDSQYIVEDVSDSQVNGVVSGALDRLHYERDPCVQFDSERKLWVYLHKDREEEDFEDDGTSSTKKWKRQKKESPDNDVVVAFDLGSDLNVEPERFDRGNAVWDTVEPIPQPDGELRC